MPRERPTRTEVRPDATVASLVNHGPLALLPDNMSTILTALNDAAGGPGPQDDGGEPPLPWPIRHRRRAKAPHLPSSFLKMLIVASRKILITICSPVTSSGRMAHNRPPVDPTEANTSSAQPPALLMTSQPLLRPAARHKIRRATSRAQPPARLKTSQPLICAPLPLPQIFVTNSCTSATTLLCRIIDLKMSLRKAMNRWLQHFFGRRAVLFFPSRRIHRDLPKGDGGSPLFPHSPAPRK